MAGITIWDKETDLYPLVGSKMTPQDVFAEWGWAENPDAVVLVKAEGGVLRSIDNLAVLKSIYGVTAEDAEEAVMQINEIMDASALPEETGPTAEERIAAALEFQNLLSM